eukprot:gnl/TRDRNA2_/TRDRNA2_79012_c1_seq2.p1 gnl/TRDRNA2_/TRDRNA2_79012_c1~~gnl/TRDRNA2_/TRDRNA2_79012_c1_seq2.p1  ORF type:complete len:141 (+),score=25.90 gnl/TRDRNA2_/TRDRNA2_79012_c1_seq2:180-602(+)
MRLLSNPWLLLTVQWFSVQSRSFDAEAEDQANRRTVLIADLDQVPVDTVSSDDEVLQHHPIAEANAITGEAAIGDGQVYGPLNGDNQVLQRNVANRHMDPVGNGAVFVRNPLTTSKHLDMLGTEINDDQIPWYSGLRNFE